jgi:phospholipid/cholesterol/gamma-HCH transport system substrate-binding protein
MDVTYKKEIGVGALVLMGGGLFVLGLFWLTGRSFTKPDVTVDVVFQTVSGLKQGDPVLVSGVKRGRVARVHLERPGRVTATLELMADVRPRIDASAAVLSMDFFGAKIIDFNPGTAEQFLGEDQPIVGTNPPDLTDVAGGLAGRAAELLGNVSKVFSDQNANQLLTTMKSLERAMNGLAGATEGPLVTQTAAAMERASRVLARFDSALARGNGHRIDTLTTNLVALTSQLETVTASLDTLLRKMNRGEGTLGRMASDTMLYQNLAATLASLNALLVDLKERPGRYLTVKVF